MKTQEKNLMWEYRADDRFDSSNIYKFTLFIEKRNSHKNKLKIIIMINKRLCLVSNNCREYKSIFLWKNHFFLVWVVLVSEWNKK
jgi:hypothetical protein